ncbi:MAG: NlpC/P60 family protein [Bacillota bacterium]|nr:NlpC/P60 family protein [Bacillota bacterium]
MKHTRFTARALASALLVTSLLSVTAWAAPSDASPTAVRVNKGSATLSSVEAANGTQSPVAVTPDHAEGSFTVVYQDENGGETTATVTAMDPETPIYGFVSAQGSGLRVRQGPGTSYAILATVTDGSVFPITGKTNGWYQITYNGRTGYVSADYLLQQNGENCDDSSNVIHPIQPPANFDGNLAQRIVDYALQFEGYPYVWATAGPDTFDCSGFTSYVYKQFGYTLNRSSKDQINNGVPVAKSDLQPADLVLFSRNGSYVTHVGLYIGDGKFIHASTSTTGVIISDLSMTYYVNCYFAARRII